MDNEINDLKRRHEQQQVLPKPNLPPKGQNEAKKPSSSSSSSPKGNKISQSDAGDVVIVGGEDKSQDARSKRDKVKAVSKLGLIV